MVAIVSTLGAHAMQHSLPFSPRLGVHGCLNIHVTHNFGPHGHLLFAYICMKLYVALTP